MEVLGSILARFGVDLGAFSHMGRIAKIIKNRVFLWFFVILGGWSGLLKRLGHCFEPCWLQDRILERILGGMLRHVGAKMAAKSAKMNQHRRKSGPRYLQQAHNPRNEEGSGSLIIAKAITKLLVVQFQQECNTLDLYTPCALRHGGGPPGV